VVPAIRQRRVFLQLGFLACLICIICLRPGFAQEEPSATKHHKIALAVRPLGLQANSGLSLAITSATRRGNRISLRVGFRNQGPGIYAKPLQLFEDDFRVLAHRSYRPLPIASVTPVLLTPIPSGGLPPSLSVPGEVVFEGVSQVNRYELQLTGFASLKFALDAENEFEPPPGGKPVKVASRLRLEPVENALGVIDLHLHSLSYDGENLRFDIGFRNGGRAPVTWNGPLTGAAARFLDTERRFHVPERVEGAIKAGVGPKGAAWKVGVENGGAVIFRGVHPHALLESRFLFPGFPAVHLSWDSAAKTFVVAPVASPAGSSSPATRQPLQARAEQQRFEDVRGLLSRINHAISANDRVGYLLGFSDIGHLRARQTELLETFDKLPVKNLRYHVPSHQQIRADPDGGASNVMVELRYEFDGVSRENVFRSVLRCDFTREPKTGALIMRAQRTESHPPFWTLGYVAFEATEHFLLFYRPGTASQDLLHKTIRQVESSYRALQKRKMTLENRYVAFFLPVKEDFIAFTGRDPNKFNGVAATFFEEDDGQIRTGNRAMYINDHRFLVEQQTWGLQDRQTTITHELVHLALAHDTRPYSPGWLVEGVALNYAKQMNSFTQHALGTRGWLNRVSLQELSQSPMVGKGMKNQEQITMQYYLSGEAVAWLTREFGDAKVIEFYRAFGELRPKEVKSFAPGGEFTAKAIPLITRKLTEHLVANHFGMTLAEVDVQVRTYVAKKTRWAR